MKKIAFRTIVGLLLMASIATACAPKSPAPAATSQPATTEVSVETSAEEPVTLEFWTYADIAQGAGLEYLNRMIAKFQETHPNVKVNITGKGDDDLLASLVTAAASGTMPDVFEQSTRSGADLRKAGAVTNIYDRWMAMPEEYRSQFNPDLLKLVTPEPGVMYAIPHTGYGNLMYRNLTVLKAAGIDPNEKVDTWDKWLEQMKKIGDVGYKAVPNMATDWFGYGSIYGGIGTREEWGIDFANNKTLVNPDKWAKTAEFLIAAKPYTTDLPVLDQGVTDLFIANQLAFYFCGSWCDPTFVAAKETSGLEYDWALIPGATPERHGGVSGYELISMNTKSAHADLAWEFLTFMTGYDAMYALGQDLGRFNANAKAMAAVDNPLIAITVEAADGAVYNAAPFFVEPYPTDYYPVMSANMTDIYEGKMTPEEGAQKLIADVNEVIANR